MIEKAVIITALLSIGWAMPQDSDQPIPRRDFLVSRQAATCAKVPSFLSGNRIVGGQDAPSPIPWQVSLRQVKAGGFAPFCGGTVLDSKTILSAAHCFKADQSMEGVAIMVGATNVREGQTVAIEKGIWNKDKVFNCGKPQCKCSEDCLHNDIVILKLKTALTFNDKVQPACLPDASWQPKVGTKCWTSGWGELEFGSHRFPEILKWVDVDMVSDQVCKNRWANFHSSMFCAGYAEGGKDSCRGDSGGPLVCSNNGQAVITGVVSFGGKCASPNSYGVYAKVTVFLDWIKANMESSSPPAPNPPAPNPPAPNPPAPAPVTCLTDYIGDGFCDDENNNAGCQFDKGDCCNQSNPGWNDFCTKCKCLQQG